jgi:hypothetical protein
MTNLSIESPMHPLTVQMLASPAAELPVFFAREGLEDMIDSLRSPYDLLSGDDSETQVAKVFYGGETYVVRSAGSDYWSEHDENESPAAQLTHRIRTLARGLGITGLEQMASYSLEDPEDPIVVAEFVAGTSIDKLSKDKAEAITGPHYSCLLNTIKVATGRRLGMDAAPSNGLFLPQNGFTLIDYLYEPQSSGFATNVGTEFCRFLGIFEDVVTQTDDYAHKKACVEAVKIGIDVLLGEYPNAIDELSTAGHDAVRTQQWLLNLDHYLEQ